MPASIELTLKELVKIALGAPQLTKVNITILHSLIDLLLKKLNCEDEKVAIGGYEASCLQRIFDKSKMSPLSLNAKHIEIISHKLDRLTDLEERIGKIDDKLERHCAALHIFKELEPIDFDLDNWQKYVRDCEVLCTVCDEENEIACCLLQNQSFLKKITRRISAPTIQRIFEFERKIEKLSAEINNFLKRAKDEYEKIAMIEVCMLRIEKLRDRMGQQDLKFIGSLEEVQDMVDAKLGTLHLPPLKQYIKDTFDETMAHIDKLIKERSCPRPLVVRMDMKCLCCGFDKACVDEYAQSLPILPSIKKRKNKLLRDFCACDKALCKKFMIHRRIATLNVPEGKPKAPTTLSMCQSTRGKLDLITGTDGQLYRKG